MATAAIASGVAGIIHLAAAREHTGDRTLLWMFILCGVVQILWATIVVARPSRSLLVTGLVVNVAALVTWALTRTVGIPFVHALAEVEEVGGQDLGTAIFEALAVVASSVALLRPASARVLTPVWVATLAVFAVVSAMPAVSAEHVHTNDHDHSHGGEASAHGAHDHGDVEVASGAHEHDPASPPTGHEHAAGDSTATHSEHSTATHSDHSAGDPAGHEHAVAGEDHQHAGPAPATGHVHPDPSDPVPGDPDPGDHDHTDPEPEAPITSLDDPRLTEEQWTAAVQLIIATTQGLAGFLTEEDILAAGYVWIGDGGPPGTYEHYVNWSYLTDAFELDPTHIESIVMKTNADGTRRVVSGMYILTLGKTMDDVPDIAGELTTWHDHDDLCLDGTQLVGLAVEVVCAQGVLVTTPPMLHVWIEENPCGPFAAIDQHGEVCDAPHQH